MRGFARQPFGAGTTVLVDDLGITLADQNVSVALTTDVEVELAEAAFDAALAEAAFSVTLDAGFSVALEPDLEVDLG